MWLVACSSWLMHLNTYIILSFSLSKNLLCIHCFYCECSVETSNQMVWGDWFRWSYGHIQRTFWIAVVHSAIHATLIHLQKPRGEIFVVDDYYSFKSKGYNIQMQGMVNHHRRFRDIFVSILGLVNNTWVLLISSMYHWEIDGNLFAIERR
jgi:hypothetical protein